MVLDKEELQRVLRTAVAYTLPALIIFIVFSIWTILGPYLSPCIFAFATSFALYEPYGWILVSLQWMDVRFRRMLDSVGLLRGLACLVVFLSIAFAWLLRFFAIPTAVGILLLTVSFLYYVCQTDREFAASVIVTTVFLLLMAGLTVALAFFMYFEIVEFKNVVVSFVQSTAVQEVLSDPMRSPIVDSILRFIDDRLGITPEDFMRLFDSYKKSLADTLLERAETIAARGVWLAYDLYDLSFSMFLFMPTLHLALQYQKKVVEVLYTLSPFPKPDTTALMNRVQNSLANMFLVYFLLGFAHFSATFLTLYVAGFRHVYLLSILAGVLATIPVFSSWIVWGPCCFYLFMYSYYAPAIFMVVVQLLLMSWIDNYLYRWMGGLPFLFSISVYLSLWTMGFLGILVGPLVLSVLPFLYDRINAYLLPVDNNAVASTPQSRLADRSASPQLRAQGLRPVIRSPDTPAFKQPSPKRTPAPSSAKPSLYSNAKPLLSSMDNKKSE
jgi:predicted PurR-regulated permease PerM